MKKIFLKIAFILTAVTVCSYADIIYVDNDLSDGFWQGAYGSLQNALNAAQSGDEIWVAQGTYTPGSDRHDSFILKEGVKLYGGFYGGEVSLDDRDFHNKYSILSGDIGIQDDITDNSYHVLSYSGVLSSTTVLDGFVIRDGYADDGKGGGGILLENGASPIISDCHFKNNQSTSGGGAATIQNAVTFKYCLFDSNLAVMGGAVYSEENRTQNGDAVFDHCTFVNNIASIGSALTFEKRESAQLDSCVFWNNTDDNGDLNSLSLSLKVSNSIVRSSAFDDASVIAGGVSGIIYYSSSDEDGPFINTVDYHLDNSHNIPREWGWYYIQAPLVLNIRVFLEGAF